MARVLAYHRPGTIDDAVELLQRPGAVPLGGGTQVNSVPITSPIEVVDLQALALDRILPLCTGRLAIGAGVTLQLVAESRDAPQVVREAARRELPSTLRAMATVAGTLVRAEAESEFVAALLAYEATVDFVGPTGATVIDLTELLANPALCKGSLITTVTIETSGVARAERAGRTPADRPIVAAVARRAEGRLRLALSGVASTPILVADVEALDPPGDFRGSSEYRKALAKVLASRAGEGTE
ncbi:MAG: FAD binding domain-containing protein [Acidimicrobiales bacterium]